MTTPSNPYLPPGEEKEPADEKPVQPEPPPAENIGMSERGIGVFALVGGCVFSYLGIIAPLLSAMNRNSSVSISMASAVMTPLVLAIGVVYTILGDRAESYLGPRNRPSIGGYVFCVFFLVVGILAYLGVRIIVRQYGYDV